MQDEERDKMIVNIDANVGFLKDVSDDQETRLRDLEAFKGQAKGVLGTLMALKVYVLATLFGGTQ